MVLELRDIQLLPLCLEGLEELLVQLETFVQEGCQLVLGISVARSLFVGILELFLVGRRL